MRYAPIAQLDRVTDYESVGRGFESLSAYQKYQIPSQVSGIFIYVGRGSNHQMRMSGGHSLVAGLDGDNTIRCTFGATATSPFRRTTKCRYPFGYLHFIFSPNRTRTINSDCPVDSQSRRLDGANPLVRVPVAVPDKIFGLTLFLDFIDRCHSLTSLILPQAALGSLPLSAHRPPMECFHRDFSLLWKSTSACDIETRMSLRGAQRRGNPRPPILSLSIYFR